MQIEKKSASGLLGLELFPKLESRFTEAKWIESTLRTAEILQPSVIDTRPTLRHNVAPSLERINLIFRREAYRLVEQDRRELYEASTSALYSTVLARIYNGAARLVDGARVAMEMAPWSMLQTAVVTGQGKNENGLMISYELDYDADGSWAADHVTQLAGTALWTNPATSEPIQDIENVKAAARAMRRPVPGIAYMNETTFYNMVSSKSLVGNNTVLINNNVILGPNAIGFKDAIKAKTDIEIVVYDKDYVDEQGVTKKYIADGNVIFAPIGKLGNTVWTKTPEAIDLTGGALFEVPRTDTSSCAIVDEAITLASHVAYEGGPLYFQSTCAVWSAPSWEAKKDTWVLRTSAAA